MSELSPEEMELMPEGSVIYDRDGDKLTKEELGFWTYRPGEMVGSNCPTIWGPYTQVPPVDPADPDYDPKRHARR